MPEIEKKAYLRSSAPLEKIQKIARYKGESEKKDIYFAPLDLKNVNIYKDPIFRIRISKEKVVLSYKKKKFIEKTEVNEEYEIDVSSAEISMLRSFLHYLGYLPFIEKKKLTRLFCLEREGFSVSIEHNRVEQLGEFIEIEVVSEEKDRVEEACQLIFDLFREIGIEEKDIEPRYYIDLLMEKHS